MRAGSIKKNGVGCNFKKEMICFLDLGISGKKGFGKRVNMLTIL